MVVVRDWGEAFLIAMADAFRTVFSFIPKLVGALIILLIGWLIANLLATLVTEVLRKVRFNQAADKAGLGKFIQASGVRKDPSSVMGDLVKWFFRLIALIAAFNVLQLPALTAALTSILNFIPNLFVALVIILIGGLIATFVTDLIKGAAITAGVGNPGLMANVARSAILFVAVIAALSQVGVAPTIVNTLFMGTVAALALAIGLAFGLGGRDVAARIWQTSYDNAQRNMPRLTAAAQQQAQQLNPTANMNYSAASMPPQNYPPTSPMPPQNYPPANPPLPNPTQPQGGYYDPNYDPLRDSSARR